MLPNTAVLTVFHGQNVDDYILRYVLAAKKAMENSELELTFFLLDNSKKPHLMSYLSENKINLNPDKFHLIEEEVPGFAKANNYLAKIAQKRSSTDYFLFLNPDVELLDNTVSQLLEVMESTKGAFSVEGSQQPLEHPKEFDQDTLETSWNSGSCLLVKPELFFELKGFDERFFMYAEDVDLSWRAWEKGYRCLYADKAEFVHYHFGISKNPYFRQFWNVRNGLLMRVKHGTIKDIIVYLWSMGRISLAALFSLNIREWWNLVKAMIAGSIAGLVYFPQFLHNIINKPQRPAFADFYGLEYAKQ